MDNETKFREIEAGLAALGKRIDDFCAKQDEQSRAWEAASLERKARLDDLEFRISQLRAKLAIQIAIDNRVG